MRMTSKPTAEQSPRRRGFLAARGLGSAAAATAAARPVRAMTPPDKKGEQKYRESEHVKQYYRVNSY
jgi:hypothetical protein